MQVASQHDLQALLHAADPDFRGCDMRGIDDLRRRFSSNQAEARPRTWSDFYHALTEGGVLTADGKSFDSNYAFWLFPASKTGAFGPENFRIIKTANVPVFERPQPPQRYRRTCRIAVSFRKHL